MMSTIATENLYLWNKAKFVRSNIPYANRPNLNAWYILDDSKYNNKIGIYERKA